MTQVGEGPRAAGQAGMPSTGVDEGTVLAERYRLDQHINNDSAGRQVWRATDALLRRQVGVVLRHPGGPQAHEMLSAAVTASRVVHPNLIGVYDAVDEGRYAFVVREWVDGFAVRDVVRNEGVWDAEQTTTVMHAVAEAVAALHGGGMAHGNVRPGTVMLADDGRPILADARAGLEDVRGADVRAVGALGYFMLTGHWPHQEAGRSSQPDALRDDDGRLIAPRQIRAGVPAYLDTMIVDLLDPRLEPPPAHVLAAELARLDTAERLLLGGAGTLRFTDEPAEPTRSSTPRLVAVGSVALALVLAGLVLAVKALSLPDDAPQAQASPPASTSSSSPSGVVPQLFPLDPSQIRIVDPPPGNRSEIRGAGLVADGDPDTAWVTEGYNQPAFGNLKPGMGVLIDLGSPQLIGTVEVQLSAPGASAELKVGDDDPGDTSDGDAALVDEFVTVGEPLVDHRGTTMVFSTDLTEPHRYVMLWLTALPPDPEGSGDRYRIGVQEITVRVS